MDKQKIQSSVCILFISVLVVLVGGGVAVVIIRSIRRRLSIAPRLLANKPINSKVQNLVKYTSRHNYMN